MRLYVGNLSYQVTDRELRDAFAAHVGVQNAEVCRDKASGQSRGFGFVELMMESDGEAAVSAMNGADLRGRNIRVEIAKPKNGRGHGAGGRHRMY